VDPHLGHRTSPGVVGTTSVPSDDAGAFPLALADIALAAAVARPLSLPSMPPALDEVSAGAGAAEGTGCEGVDGCDVTGGAEATGAGATAVGAAGATNGVSHFVHRTFFPAAASGRVKGTSQFGQLILVGMSRCFLSCEVQPPGTAQKRRELPITKSPEGLRQPRDDGSPTDSQMGARPCSVSSLFHRGRSSLVKRTRASNVKLSHQF
jgi:hypothetical protein